uniref:ATP synthase subunit s, mitochondrial n=1 Tax=Caenorhabditis japonica TaxID=281687 RepID=A0A8R1DGG5_CAEJA
MSGLRRLQEKMVLALGQHNIPGLRWIIEGFNYYDTQRVKEVGADRAAAEWIVKCGGQIKFAQIDESFDDFNALVKRTAQLDPRRREDNVTLETIRCVDASVTGFGCRHFENLRGIRHVHFIGCKNFHDFGLEYMGQHVGDCLKTLHLESCPRITEFGLEHLNKFSALETLILRQLKSVHGKEKVEQKLRKALPKTDIQINL